MHVPRHTLRTIGGGLATLIGAGLPLLSCPPAHRPLRREQDA